MQVQASAKFVRTSPRKVRLVMQGLRGMPVEDARLQLRFTPKPIARDVAKVLDSAVAWYECRVVGQAEPGDHVVYFGEVTGGAPGPAEGEATTLAAVGMSYAG